MTFLLNVYHCSTFYNLMCICVCHASMSVFRSWIPWNLTYRHLQATVLVLGIEPTFFGGTANTENKVPSFQPQLSKFLKVLEVKVSHV